MCVLALPCEVAMSPYFVRPFVLNSNQRRVTVARRGFLYRGCHEQVLNELQASSGKVVQMTLSSSQYQLFGPLGYGVLVKQSCPDKWFSSVALHSDRTLNVTDWLTRDMLVSQGRHLMICLCTDGDVPSFRERLRQLTWLEDTVCVLGLRVQGTLCVSIEDRREKGHAKPQLGVDSMAVSTPLSHRDTQYISTMLYQIIMECFVMGFRSEDESVMPCRHYSIQLSGFRSVRHWP